ncbi:putative malate dehydrogenase [Calothrix sp. NIES-4071]|nr:putative malate dehydrogenase [Calothrix sp. NIES-4071]BAZ64136.1 putative malate dehydrogenase [Calothrix sp. NIES-4105]
MSSIIVSHQTLHEFLDSVLAPYNLLPEVKNALINHLVEANLWGVDSHGLQQIIGYIKSLRSGRINPTPQPKVLTTEGKCIIRIDGDLGPGQFVAQTAMQSAIETARNLGIGAVGVTNSNHMGMAGYYTQMAAMQGMVAFATSDTNAVDLAPYGGRVARVGNNPMSWGIPTGTDQPIILDMATGAVSGGKIKHFAYQGLPIPLGWGLNAAGEVDADPKQISVNLPASYKGSGMAFVMDLLCGPMLGTAAAMFKNKSIHDAANGTGHLFIVFDVAVWTDKSEFEENVRKAIAELKETPRLDPEHEIYYPGELEHKTRLKRLSEGIPIPTALRDDLASFFQIPDFLKKSGI